MKILTVDIGTGTQDIFLYDSRVDLENGLKMVVPSPTMIVRRRIQAAARRGESILLTGVTMGGGPSHWAVEDHLAAGLKVYATPEAARSFNDDLEEIRSQGIRVVSEDEAAGMKDVQAFDLKDFDFEALAAAFAEFDIRLDDLDALAITVFDHGAAPPGYSDRKFRFEYIERQLAAHNRLSGFAFPAGKIPAIMTRMQAVSASTSGIDAPVMLMDTAPAAVLGATLDPRVRSVDRPLVANIGNFHTLAFRLGKDGVEGVFEHHTGLVDRRKMEFLFQEFAAGRLTDEYVFEDKGHGARIISTAALPLKPGKSLTVVGPRRAMMAGSDLKPYFAAPFGDMMLVGCFGMLAAAADVFPHFAGEIHENLYKKTGRGVPPWELN